MSWIVLYSLTTLAALLSTYLLMLPLRRFLYRWRAVDVPNERSSHTHPTSRGGGLLIVAITMSGLFILLPSLPFPHKGGVVIVAISAIVIATVSWIDDLRSLSNRVRLGVHGVGAILAILSLGYWHEVELPGLGVLPFGWLGPLITFIWIVGLTNAYNFMDGIDGIAGSQAVVAGIGWATIGYLVEEPLVGVLGVLIAATNLGFLGHNWQPADIFMGDVGSAFLGYIFAVLPLVLAAAAPANLTLAVLPIIAALMVWPFVFDTTITIIRRLRNGDNIFTPHRSHLYQRLVITGYSHRFVTMVYVVLASIGVMAAMLLATATDFGVWFAIMGIVSAGAGLVLFVLHQERRHVPEKVFDS